MERTVLASYTFTIQLTLLPSQIYRKDVDDFEPGRCIPPKCELLVEWDLEDKKPVRLRHKINLIGAREPYNFFNLSLNPAWKDSMPTQYCKTCSFV